jgi:hypothetical protein
VIANGIPSAPASVTVAAAPDFTLSVTPANQTIRRAATATYKVMITAVNGFNGVVTFSVSGLPSLATGTFNPTSVTGSGTSTLTVSTAKKTPAGTYSLKITGKSNPLVHSDMVSLTVSNNGK